MTTRHVILLAAVGAAGCARQPPAAAPVVAVVANTPAVIREVSIAPAPRVVPEPVIVFPPDLAGGALPKVVAPVEPPLPAATRFGTTPTERTPPATLLVPEPAPKTVFAPAPVPPPTPIELKPTAPAERVPPDVGFAVQPPKLPDTPAKVEKARDVNLPPPLPSQARRASERVQPDDPTAAGPPPPAGFVMPPVPDPPAPAARVWPKTLPAEPALTPVPVTPPRP